MSIHQERESPEEHPADGHELIVPFLNYQDWEEHSFEVTLVAVEGPEDDDSHLMTEWVTTTMEDVVHLEDMR